MPLVIRLSIALLGGVLLTLLAWRTEAPEELEGGPSLAAVQIDRDVRSLPARGRFPLVQVTRRLTLQGNGFRRLATRRVRNTGLVDERNVGQPEVSFEFTDGRDIRSPMVRFQDERTVIAWVPEGARGTARVVLRNPDGRGTALVVDL